jgi:hypothetical protein
MTSITGKLPAAPKAPVAPKAPSRPRILPGFLAATPLNSAPPSAAPKPAVDVNRLSGGGRQRLVGFL